MALLHSTLCHPYHFVLRCAHWTCPCRGGGGGAAVRAGGGGEEGDAVAICSLRHRVMQLGFELRAGKTGENARFRGTNVNASAMK